VLCDIGLPGELDGYAVARALQSEPGLAGAYRVALSGYAQPGDQKRAREAGFEAHLSKPPDLAALDRLLTDLRSASR
jgi:CheY-like chemotaxis protein